jgi:amidohydrolase
MPDTLTTLRQWLHANPEISGNEKNTALYIQNFLSLLKPDKILTNLGGHGMLALFDSGNEGSSIMFRSEIDALPIQEINTFSHRSKFKNISHKCGHDGHTAILCGLAKKLSKHKISNGKIYLLFQPSEETGEGAQAVMNDPAFDIQPDFVFALHNLPGFKKGNVILKEGSFSAAVNSVIIRLFGKETHAAEPENGINPSMAISDILKIANSLNNYDISSTDFGIITPICLNMGAPAYGTAAGNGELHFTLRSWNDENLRKLENTLIKFSKSISKQYNLQTEHEFLQTFYANNNDKECVNTVKEVALDLNYEIEEKKYPFKWGEDFGFFTSKFKGCMFGIGVGENYPALHNSDYDFPDESIEQGINMFYGIAQKINTQS